jgi:sarcosine oxidase, subunit alpha
MSTTSSGAEAVLTFLEHLLAVDHPDWRIHLTPMTSEYASINIAGPNSRTLLGRLSERVDLAPEAFPYMHVRTATIAGVPGCLAWRIGFTGELSYEIHVPAASGLPVWEALLDQGADLGAAPFGVEAQRIMRLEKGHFIVGQDTDGLTRGFSAGLGPLVKLDKAGFLGQPELAWQAEAAGRRTSGDGPRLVGLQPVDGSIVPDEASLIIDNTEIVGRVTSSRMSPTLGRSVCLAQLPSRLAGAGTLVTVRLPNGRDIQARVTPQLAHHDPEGSRTHG